MAIVPTRMRPRRGALAVAVALVVLAWGTADARADGINDADEPDAVKVPLAELAASAWRVDELGGRGVVDRVRSTLGFRAGQPAGVYGSGGCNRYTGGVREAEGRLVLGPLASTRRMCPPAVMDQERRFFAALERAAGFERRGPYLYVLDAEGGDLARLTPLEGEA